MIKFWRLLLLAVLAVFLAACSTVKKTTPSTEIKDSQGALPKTDTLIAELLQEYPQYFDSLLKEHKRWNIKIIYTQIDRKADNEPVLTHYYYNIDPSQYFYPASTVKMPAAVLSLQRLNELNISGVDRNTTMITEDAGPGLTAVHNDPSSEDGRPTIAHYIKNFT